MARVTPNGFTGLVGTVVFYEMNGETYVRAKPRKRKKKKGEEPNPINTIFGTVSICGSRMIKEMRNSFQFPFTRATYNQARGWMYNEYKANHHKDQWELSVKNHSMCQLNDTVDLRDFLKTGFDITGLSEGKISVSFPSINPVENFKVPPKTKKIRVKIIVLTAPFQKKNELRKLFKEEYILNYKDEILPEKEFIISTGSEKGDMAMVVIAIEYATSDPNGDLYLKNLNCLPAAIVSMGRLG